MENAVAIPVRVRPRPVPRPADQWPTDGLSRPLDEDGNPQGIDLYDGIHQQELGAARRLGRTRGLGNARYRAFSWEDQKFVDLGVFEDYLKAREAIVRINPLYDPEATQKAASAKKSPAKRGTPPKK